MQVCLFPLRILIPPNPPGNPPTATHTLATNTHAHTGDTATTIPAVETDSDDTMTPNATNDVEVTHNDMTHTDEPEAVIEVGVNHADTARTFAHPPDLLSTLTINNATIHATPNGPPGMAWNAPGLRELLQTSATTAYARGEAAAHARYSAFERALQ